jgi:pilus assembly protein FimV
MGRDLAPGHPLFAEPASTVAHEHEEAAHPHEPLAHEPPAPFSFDEPHYNLSAAPSSSVQASSLDNDDVDGRDGLPADAEPALWQADEPAALEPASSTLPEGEQATSVHVDEVSPPWSADEYTPPPLHDEDSLPPNRWQFDEPLLDEPLSTNPSPSKPMSPELDLSLDEGLTLDHDDVSDGALSHFSDDPVDTKLDLARAYLDMGDAEGARSMLDEVLSEGSQMQQDVARKLLTELH